MKIGIVLLGVMAQFIGGFLDKRQKNDLNANKQEVPVYAEVKPSCRVGSRSRSVVII